MSTEQVELKYNSVVFVQINDVYHIDTSANYSNDQSLILPRIATIIKRLRNHLGKDRVFFCLPGDFLGPSCLSKEFKGAQMVDVLNTMGLDYATFGNHEFEEQFTSVDVISRIEESSFKWISSNFMFVDETNTVDRGAIHQQLIDKGQIAIEQLIELSDNNIIVILGLMYEGKFPGFGKSFNPIELCRRSINQWKNDLKKVMKKRGVNNYGLTFVALTHQTLTEDIKLAENCSEIRLIMGGHDHDVLQQHTGTHTLIAKTISNARSLRFNFIISVSREQIDSYSNSVNDFNSALRVVSDHLLLKLGRDLHWKGILTWVEEPLPEDIDGFNDALHKYAREEYLGLVDGVRMGQHKSGDDYIFVFSMAVDTTNKNFIKIVPEDNETRGRIKHWLDKSKEASTPIIKSPRELIVEDRYVRKESTNFGNLIADIVRGAYPLGDFSRNPSEVGLINSGSFRLDRNIQENENISQKTLCDIFFHPNSIQEFELKGIELLALLKRSLDLIKGSQEGSGEFLQISGIEVQVRDWSITDVKIVSPYETLVPLVSDHHYTVATTNYVANKCQEYKDFFAGKRNVRQIAEDIKSAVEAALIQLENLAELGELKLPFFPVEQLPTSSFFEIYLARQSKARWIYME